MDREHVQLRTAAPRLEIRYEPARGKTVLELLVAEMATGLWAGDEALLGSGEGVQFGFGHAIFKRAGATARDPCAVGG